MNSRIIALLDNLSTYDTASAQAALKFLRSAAAPLEAGVDMLVPSEVFDGLVVLDLVQRLPSGYRGIEEYGEEDGEELFLGVRVRLTQEAVGLSRQMRS
jgi:hypothetical protein